MAATSPQTTKEIKNKVRESLGLKPKNEPNPTFPMEGHVCDFPLWSYSKKRSSVKLLRIDYDDGSYFTLHAPEGMPSPSFPGYLDVLLFHGQYNLFEQSHVEISVYSIFKTLGLDPNDGRSYDHFRRDMRKAFSLIMETDRFINPITGKRSHVNYFRILNSMKIAKTRNDTSLFYFNDIFLDSLRSSYLKRLDLQFCLYLDKNNKALARFLYAHILKRIGKNSMYIRRFPGFLSDIGLGYLMELPPRNRNQKVKQSLHPALDLVKGKAFRHQEIDDNGNIFFLP